MLNMLARGLRAVRKFIGRFGRAGSVEIDCAAVQRMRKDGMPWRELAKRLPGSPPESTVRYRYERWLSEHPAPLPVATTPDPAQTAASAPERKPVVTLPAKSSEPIKRLAMPDGLEDALSDLRSPGAAKTSRPSDPLPGPESEVDVSEIWGLDLVPEGCREFFLVMGRQNQECAQHMAQNAIGLNRWDAAYWRLPLFRTAQKVWIVLNDGDDNRRFLMSVAADTRLRAMVLIAPVRRNSVRFVCQERLLAQREEGRGYKDGFHFENVQGFKPLPTDARELAKLLPRPEKPKPEEPWSSPLEHREPWRIPQTPR
jgi:hypothetical protein